MTDRRDRRDRRENIYDRIRSRPTRYISFDEGSEGGAVYPHLHDAGDVSGVFDKVVVSGDIYGNWNGANPANLATVDTAATTGFYFDSSAGAAQLMGDLFLGGDALLIGSGSFQTDTGDTDYIKLSAQSSALELHVEAAYADNPGLVTATSRLTLVAGSDEVPVVQINSGSTTGDDPAVHALIPENDDATHCEYHLFYGPIIATGATTAGQSASLPALVFNSDNLDTGLYESAASEISATIDSSQVWATTSKGLKAVGAVTLSNNVITHLGRSTAQTIGTSSWTAMSWDTETFDIAGWHEGVTNPSRITPSTLPSGSLVLVTANIAFESDAVGDRHMEIRKSGTAIMEVNVDPSATDHAHLFASVPNRWVTGEYYEVYVWQDSGGDLDVESGLAKCHFSVVPM